MLGLYFANLHICDEQNAQNCIFYDCKSSKYGNTLQEIALCFNIF